MSFPYYRFFPGDYLRDTRRLTLLQHGAYHLLIHDYMAGGQPLRGDLDAMCRICGALSGEERAAVEYVLSEFFTKDGPAWLHKRCDAELNRQTERSGEAVNAANVRWHSKRNADAMQTHSERNAIQNQNQNQNQNQSVESLQHPTVLPTPTVCDPPVEKDLWTAFKRHRVALKAPLTPHAETLLCKKLRIFAAAGHDPAKIVEQSIERGWKGVFLLDRDKSQGKSTLAEQRKANMDELCGRAGDGRPNADGVDRTPVFEVSGYLRKPDGDDVG